MGRKIGRIATGFATGGISEVIRAGEPNTPEYPGFSPQEAEVLKKLNSIYDSESAYQKQQRSLYQQFSNLYDKDGNLNQAEVEKLRAKFKEASDLRGQNLGDITNLEQQRYLAALRGEGDLTEADKQRRVDEFNQLKESLSRRGIRVDGDTPETATANSTAGVRALSEFNKRYSLIRDEQQRAERASGASLDFARRQYLGGFAASDPSLGLLDKATAYSPTTLTPILGDIADRYQSQRLGQFQRDSAASSAKSRYYNGLINGAFQLGGMAAGGYMSRPNPGNQGMGGIRKPAPQYVDYGYRDVA